MDELRTIAEVSRRSGSSVERMGSSLSRSSMGTLAPHGIHYRRKTITLAVATQSPLTLHALMRNFDLLRQPLFIEHGPAFRWSWCEEALELISVWLDGETLADHVRRNGSPHTPDSLANRLRLWARTFERLAQWHAAGIVHGNLKPENILICSRMEPELERRVSSELFSNDETVPHVALLDGSYAHLLEVGNESVLLRPRDVEVHDVFWHAPEVRGIVEAAVTPLSDLFSMAAIMAHDLGLLTRKAEADAPHGALSCLWPLFPTGNEGDAAEAVSRPLEKLRSILGSACRPLPCERVRTASQVAREILAVAREIAGARENGTLFPMVSTHSVGPNAHPTWKDAACHRLAPLPELLRSLLSKPRPFRHWLLARDPDTSLHERFQQIRLRLALEGLRFLAYRVSRAEESIPFSALDAFLSRAIGDLCRRVPEALPAIRRELGALRQGLRIAREVLPSLKLITGSAALGLPDVDESSLKSRHESLGLAIDSVLRILFSVAHFDVVLVDDLHRADAASLRVFLRLLESGFPGHWVLGVRSCERTRDERLSRELARIMSLNSSGSDIVLHVEAGQERRAGLDSLNPSHARLLAAIATLPSTLGLREVSEIARNALRIPHLVGQSYHGKKTSLSKIIDHSKSTSAEVAHPPGGEMTVVLEVVDAARRAGILCEVREPATGRIRSLRWTSQREAHILAHLLDIGSRSELFLRMVEGRAKMRPNGIEWHEALRLAELFLGTSLARTAHATFSALMQASERIHDLDSCEWLLTQLTLLEGKLRWQRSPHAEALVPKIRERMADLAVMKGDFDRAHLHYATVLLDTDDAKRRVVIAMRSFMPFRHAERNDRAARFDAIVKEACRAGFVSKPPRSLDAAHRKAFDLMETIELMLNEKSALSGKELLVRPLAELIDIEKPETETEGLVYPARSHALRAQILSQFVRASTGWVDGARLLPIALVALEAALEERHGRVTAEVLLTVCLSMGSQISSEHRQRALRSVGELGARTGNDQLVLESLLSRAWYSYFVDGRLDEAHRLLSRLQARSAEMPQGHRILFERLRALVDRDEPGSGGLAPPEERPLSFRMPSPWPVGEAYLSERSLTADLESSDPEATLPTLLSEQMDQALLFFLRALESGPVAAEEHCIAAASEKRNREWLADPWSPLRNLPSGIERMLGQMGVFPPDRPGLAATEPDLMLALAVASAKCGYLWLAHRFSDQAGMPLASVLSGLSSPEPSNRTDEATTLNYILELLHRFQWNVETDIGLYAGEVGRCLEKSIPPSSGLAEETIARAAASAARRLKFRSEETKREGNLTGPHDERRAG